MNEAKVMAKSTVIYLFGSVGTKLINFFLLPLYTAYILPASFGTYDLNITYAILFSSVAFLDIWTGIMKFVFEKKGVGEKNKVIYNGILIFLISTVVYTVFMFTFTQINNLEYPALVYSYGFFHCFQNLWGYLARSFGKNTLFAVSGIAATLTNAILNIVLLVWIGMDYSSLYIAFGVSVLVQFLIIEFKLRIISSFKARYLDKETFRIIARFSLPLCVNSICYWLLTGYNKVVINEQLGDVANGYYTVAARFAAILNIVSSCVSMAWQEIAYSKYEKNKETANFYSRALDFYLKALLCGYMVILPAIYVVFPYLVDSAYNDAKNLIPTYMLATFVGVLFTFLGNIIATYRKSGRLFLSTFCACVVNIAVLYAGIGHFGVEAANIALLFGFLVSVIVHIITIKRLIEFRINIKTLLYLVPCVAVTWLAFYRGNLIWNLIVAGIGCLLFGILFKDFILRILRKIKSYFF